MLADLKTAQRESDILFIFTVYTYSIHWPAFAQMNHSELSHMAGAVDDSTINIVVVIIIIIVQATHMLIIIVKNGDYIHHISSINILKETL